MRVHHFNAGTMCPVGRRLLNGDGSYFERGRLVCHCLLVETDAPYLAPPPHRGKRNEPAFVVNTARVLAQTLNVSEAEIADITTANFFRLFSKARRPGESDG